MTPMPKTTPEEVARPWLNDPLQDALNRMRRAHERGTGCNLTAAMIQGLALSFLAETWGEPDPRNHLLSEEKP